ncbi:Endonuclease/exonuclease/phosphatase [Dichotomocladium elegans]|nr:Endonuclease/exonuclease/phosphatase [Dichotomocladium elegans]
METNKDAYVRYDPTKENTWVKAILNGLGHKADQYYKVASQQLVTILIIVIAKKPLQSFIKDVSTNYVPVGFMNIMGNKGGVGIRLRFHESYICFVGCHLAAFTDQIDRRNQDFNEICKRLVFQHHPNPALDYVQYGWNDEGVSFLETHGVCRDWWDEASVFHSDYLIWLGDLNYRINLSEPEIKTRLRRQALDALLPYDQLLIERQAGRAFQMFEEGEIKFMPTYKFDAGTDQYDSSIKRRAPSWTDRILWKTSSATAPPLELLAYDCCMQLRLSDHKPVYAHMKAKIRHIDRSKLKEAKYTLEKMLSTSADVPGQGRISGNIIDFENVAFMEYKEHTLVLENTGQILAPFRLIPKSDETTVCPPWLLVYPKSGILGPGDKVVIHIAVMVDRTISTAFNEGVEMLATTLVIRMENVSDFFVEVTGKYQPTCFGLHLERLALMTVPITALTPNRTVQATEPIGQQATLPKELWRVLNFLWNENMLCSRTLFFEHGNRVTAEYIRRCLDTGDPFDTNRLLGTETPDDEEPVGPRSMVDILVTFLECLPEPVIPQTLYTLAIEATDSSEAMAELKERLPYIHLTVLLHLISFLQDAIRFAPEMCRVARKAQIVHMFTVLLRPPHGYKEQNPLQGQQKREQFVDCLIDESIRFIL